MAHRLAKYPWIQISLKYLNIHYQLRFHQISYWPKALGVGHLLLGFLMDNVMLSE